MKTYGETLVNSVIAIICDCCGRTYDNPMEMQEFLSYSDTCGYGAVYDSYKYGYADGDRISIDLCQYCKYDLLGKYFKVDRSR